MPGLPDAGERSPAIGPIGGSGCRHPAAALAIVLGARLWVAQQVADRVHDLHLLRRAPRPVAIRMERASQPPPGLHHLVRTRPWVHLKQPVDVAIGGVRQEALGHKAAPMLPQPTNLALIGPADPATTPHRMVPPA